jgi:putative heme-binding domain-containing protein
LRLCVGFLLALLANLVPALSLRADDAGRFYRQTPERLPAVARTASGAENDVATATVDWSAGPTPEWIWGGPGDDPCVLKTTFAGGVRAAWLKASCDNEMTLFLNGRPIGESRAWESPLEINLQEHLRPGENELAAEVRNRGSACGFVAKLVLERADGSRQYIVSGGDWRAAPTRDAKEWSPARSIAQHGAAPWGEVLTRSARLPAAAPGDQFEVRPGFQVERLFTVPKEQLGSWVCLTVDPQGRLIASDQGDKGLCRITPPGWSPGTGVQSKEQGGSGETVVEKLDLKITAAQGLLFAFGHLYLSVNGGPGSGLYRAKYDAPTDSFGPVEKLKEFRGGGEHGPHALRLSPDGQSIYVICGNHTRPPFDPILSGEPQTMGGVRGDVLRATLPEGMSSRILPNWDEDLLLPRVWDARGHARGILAPGGWIAQTDPEGKTWEIISIGYRNPYDMAFNADGELFAYDADMEWDMGMPWYRPTRVVHATSGSEFGWRSGSGKWPTYYLDSLPPVVDIGPGSPVGVEFGYGAKFPARYQKALYLADWTFGTIYAVHLTPQGSTYVGEKEEFLARNALPLTDLVIGHDGAMYFTIGGRGTQSELFRVTYVGDEPTDPVDAQDVTMASARAERRRIEALHTGLTLEAGILQRGDELAAAYEALAAPDRFLRYAARIAFEQMSRGLTRLPEGIEFAEHIRSPRDLAQFATTIARIGLTDLRPEMLRAMQAADLPAFTEVEQLDYLRALSLLFIRLGPPDEAVRQAFIAKLDPLYPSESAALNRELVQMLVFLESPTIVEKAVATLAQPAPQATFTAIDPVLARNQGYGGTIAEMLAHQPDVERIWTAFVLRNAKTGWTLDLKKRFFQFLSDARNWKGGASYQGFLTFIDAAIWDATPEKERLAIEGAGVRKPFLLPELPKPKGPGHNWTIDEVLAKAEGQLNRGRDFKNGERTYAAARCIVCHRFAGDGGATGPDLTQLAGRFNLKDLTESILDPGKVVSDQYRATTVVTTTGKVYTGRVVNETDQAVTMLVDPEDASKVVDIPRGEIDAMQPAAASLMPADLLKTLNEEEVLDLLAYLLSRGDPGHPMFRRR